MLNKCGYGWNHEIEIIEICMFYEIVLQINSKQKMK